MNAVDIVFLVATVLCVVLGVFKGLIRQVLTIVGIFAVATLTATLAPYVQGWFAKVIENEHTRSLVAMIIAAILLTVAYSVVALLLTKILKKLRIIGVLDKILGGVLGFAVVYMIFAVLFALFNETGEDFMPLLKKSMGKAFAESWVGRHIYFDNFFGNWVIIDIAQKLLNSITPAA